MSSAPLTLKALPTLLTDCVLVGHAKRADYVFTSRQFFALAAHMMNGNPANFFLMPYRDKDGSPKFAKAFGADAEKRTAWAWDTITGKAKLPASIGFYPTNQQQQSRWAAMDFDNHDGDQMRARQLALEAFKILYQQPDLFVALTTSAGDPVDTGWHLFIFSADFFPCEEWTRLLRQVAHQIGVPVQAGLCEIFPDDCRGIGRGIRAPGTWNPKTGECGLILHETVSRLVSASLPAKTPKEVYASLCLGVRPKDRTPSSEFAVTAPSTRHQQLLKLVGATFLQIGRSRARKSAELQHAEARPSPAASLAEHLREFDEAWAGMERQWLRKLSPAEREKFDALTTSTNRDAFRIVQNWSQTDSPDFRVHCSTLGDRIGVGLSGAAKIRQRFCTLGILRQTARYVPHRLSARYQWTA
jgi:hypothetical protein